ncbi:MAG: hypothetical protein JO065_19450 [Acidobacteria bacterium]|nr:hypothetical protein [Acidobacteriota bacterium]
MTTLSAAFASITLLAQIATAQTSESLLARHYTDGEGVAYHMSATNVQGSQKIAYDADAKGIVKKDASGIWYEEIGWSNLVWNGQPVTLPAASQNLRQNLSLDPNSKLSVPNLAQVDPRLIGPITDLLTFYADLTLAIHQPGFAAAGAHKYFAHGTPNSWADGVYVILGQDSIDFDVTLSAVNAAAHTATLLVKHVPPAKPQIKLPASWMQAPVADTPNNWVMVTKASPGTFVAQIGKETFDVKLEVDTKTGRILSASMDNPVQATQRVCSDEALTQCPAPPVPLSIRRQIHLESIAPIEH